MSTVRGYAAVPGLSDAVQPIPTVTPFPAVNTFTLASFEMPGKWTLLEADKVFGWQIQQGYGLSGAFIFPKGDPLVTVKFRGEFWSPPDYALYKEIRKQLLTKAVFTVGGALLSSAMGIDHPELKLLGVTSVVPLRVSPTMQEEGGLWVASLDLLQYRAPLPALPKPKTVIPSAAAPAPSATDNQARETVQLQSETAGLIAAF
jgi:hypothetical protein